MSKNESLISNPEGIPQVLALTDEWWVVNKPAGWLTIPDRHSAVSEGRSRVLSKWVEAQQGSSVWVCHRLDRDTSGVIVFARTAESHQKANQWFQERKVKKTYQSLSSGIPFLPILKLNSAIREQSALTQVEILESYQEGFFAEVFPKTGRRHQIRIHLANAGFPIWGDLTYKGCSQVQFESDALAISRVALHARSLVLPSGVKFEAPLPEDFQSWLKELREKGRRV